MDSTPHTSPASQANRPVLVFLLTFLYVGGLPLLYALRYKSIAPTYLFAGDAFYYFDIAHRSLGFHGFTFDGQYMTNSFHPLWEYCLLLLAKCGIVDFTSPASALLPVFFFNLLLLAVGAASFSTAATRYLQHRMLALLIAGPGLIWILTGLIDPGYCSTWAYVNGMESALALLCFAGAFLIYRETQMAAARTLGFAILLGLGTLARLDDIFIAAAMAALFLWNSPATQRTRSFLYLFPLPLMVAAYLAYNHHTLGFFLPISGGAKAGFALIKNVKWSFSLFLPVLTGDGPSALLGSGSANYYGFGERATRLVQMLLPMVLGIVELALVFRFRERRFNLIHAAAVGVIGKASYNLIFVEVWYQGTWYYTVSIAFANLILVLWIDRVLARLSHRTPLPLSLAIHALCVLFAFNVFISRRNFIGPVNKVSLLANSDPIRNKLKSLGANRFIEFDDGFISYASGVPSLAGLGLALDPEAQHAMHQGEFLTLAEKRGYRIIIADSSYATIVDDMVVALSQGGKPALAEIHPSEFTRYTIKPLGGDGTDDAMRFYEIDRIPSKP
jgi:hypothetical protein